MFDKVAVLDGAKQAFFAAMLAGYANDGTTSTEGLVEIKTPDGYTTIEFTTGDYKVVDRYCTTPHSNRSAGTTTISWKGDPIWWMSYSGYYETEEAIVFLKKVLRSTYERGMFMGGRGPVSCSDSDPSRSHLRYENSFNSNYPGVFEGFEGLEEIWDESLNEILGEHSYTGMSLI